MAHDLQETNGIVSFMNAGDRRPAWHRLGTELPEMVDGETALRVAHLDYLVTKEPQTVTVLGANGFETLDSPDVAMVRPNAITGRFEIVGTASPAYEIVQNHEWIPFADAVVAEGGAHYATAGEIRSGARIFISLKLPKGIMIGGVDQIDNYLVISSSHDASSSAVALVTPIRVVCANTFGGALRNNVAKITLRHTRHVRDRMALARQALGITVSYLAEFESMANEMLATPFADSAFDQLIDAVWVPKDHSKDKTTRGATIANERTALLRHLYRTAETNEIGRGTAWGALNAITEYADHFQSADADRNALRVVTGGTDDVKRKALALLSR